MSYPKNQAEKCLQIYQTINQLISQTQNIDRNYASLKQKFENLSLIIEEMFNFNQQYEQCLSSPSSDNHQQIMQYKQREDAALQVSLNEFKTLRISFVEAFNNVIETAEYVLNEIIAEHLQNWRENQILVGNGFQQLDPEILNKIQSWCENLAQVLWNTRMQLMAAPMYSGQLDDEDKYIHNVLNELSVKVLKIMHTLVKETVIIEVQPPQVIKKNTRFSTTIRLLIGNALNIKMISPHVQVSIVSEQQAQMSQQLQNIMDSNSGDLLNSSGRFSFDETTSKLRAPFSAMQIKNIKRSEKKGAENVSDEKFALLFQSHFSIGDGALIINITALSMPIVVIVHGSQEPQSQATILWDNAFSTFHRQPFYVESSAMWDILAAAMKMKFCAPSNPSIVVPNADIFSNQMLEALRKKALRQYGLATTSSPITSSSITWSQFCKDPLPDRNFTFWEWFHAAMKLIRDHLCDLWNRNYIMGFIDKQSAENLLLKCKPGTFLLRFSDSELGGLTIAFLKLNENNSSYVLNIEPLNSKKLLFRSLPDRILDLDELKTLHPNIHKSLAFGGHAKIPEQSTTGYVAMNVQVSLPRSNISEIHENFNRMNVNHPSSSSLIGLQEDSTNIQLPEFNFCFSEYEETVMDTDWLNENKFSDQNNHDFK